jgi:hypothetical protein
VAALTVVMLALGAVQIWRSSPADRPAAPNLHSLRTPARFAEWVDPTAGKDVEVSGFLNVPETGTYGFETNCGGHCTVWVEERVVVSGAGFTRASASLAAGIRPVRFTLKPAARRPYARFDWNRPALFEVATLGDAVTSDPASPDLRARERRTLVRAAAHALLGAVALFLVFDLSAAARLAMPALPGASRRWLADPAHRAGVVAGGLSLAFLAGLHAWIAPRALPDGYLHPWTSEFMMQTVSVADLRDEPLRSLVFNHIQPPMFDALRALLVMAMGDRDGGDPAALVIAVDRGLYACWAVAYAMGAALVATWMGRLGGVRAAALGSVFYALHPATLFYATYLDSTLVSALGVLWVTYELWKFRPGGEGSTGRLRASVVMLFLTRSIVQWPFLAVLVIALLLRGNTALRAMRIVAAIALVMALFIAKQYLLFGLTITSSFGPDSFCKGLWEYCPGTTAVETPPLPAPRTASALRRVAKVNDEYNYNQLAWVRRSFAQMAEYKVRLVALAPTEIARRMSRNLSKWLLPSSRHSPHVLVDALPWRGALDRVMSGWALVALVLAASAFWWASARFKGAAFLEGIGLALPIVYVAAVSIAFERNENMRYKFFVEPALMVLIVSQAAAAARALRRRAISGDRAASA